MCQSRMEAFEETKEEHRARYLKGLKWFFGILFIFMAADFIYLEPKYRLEWGTYIVPICMLVFVFIWPGKRRRVELTAEEISTETTAYPLEKVTKIASKKSGIIVHATGMDNWQIPMFTELSNLPSAVQKLKPSVEVHHDT